MTWRHIQEDKIISTTAVRTSNLTFRITISIKKSSKHEVHCYKTNLLGQSYNGTAALSGGQRLNIFIFEFFFVRPVVLKRYPRVCWEFSLTASAVKMAFHPTKHRKTVQLFEGRSVKYRILIL
jgi:hypothetical protein